MARRFLLVATAAALVATVPAGAAAQTSVPTSAYLAPATYAGSELKGFTPRDAQPLYTDALKKGCSNAAGVDAAQALGPASGSGVLLGTSDGRIVVSESIHVFPNAKAAKRFVTTARSSTGCLGYAGRDSINRVFVQYPALPPVPTFAPASSSDGGTVFATFEGTNPTALLAGSTALTTWDAFVAETSVRIAVPKPGELDSLSQSIFTSVGYNARSTTFAASNPKLAQQADALAQDFLARATTNSGFAFQPSPRSGLPANPSSCGAATAGYVYSGVHGAVRGFAGQDATTHVAAKPELIVFANATDADRYLKSYSNLATCYSDLYKGGLPPGSRVSVQRVPKRGTDTSPKTADAKTVAYVSTLAGPDGAQIGKTAVVVMTAGSRAAFLLGQIASSDTTVDVRAQLDQLEGDLGAVLSRK
jgi:hypothetical protein